MNVLFFKENINTQAFQFPDGLKKRHRVPGKAGNALSNNQVDIPFAAFLKHLLKTTPPVLGTGHGFITVDTEVLPAGMALDYFAVIADLR